MDISGMINQVPCVDKQTSSPPDQILTPSTTGDNSSPTIKGSQVWEEPSPRSLLESSGSDRQRSNRRAPPMQPAPYLPDSSPNCLAHKYSDSFNSFSSETPLSSPCHSRLSSATTLSGYVPQAELTSLKRGASSLVATTKDSGLKREGGPPRTKISVAEITNVEIPHAPHTALNTSRITPNGLGLSNNARPFPSNGSPNIPNFPLTPQQESASLYSPPATKITDRFFPTSPAFQGPPQPASSRADHITRGMDASSSSMASSLPPAADNSQASNPPPALNPSTASNTLATAPQNVPKCRAVDNCNTGSDLRKAVSHVFGRNKLCTRLIPDYVWVYFCRKHYQRGRYRNAQEYAKTQCDLVYRQIELVQEWSDRNRQKRDGGIVVQWTVALRKREHVRLQNAFNRQTQGQEVDTKDPAVILGTAVPSWLRSKVGDGYSTHDLLDIVARMKDDVIRLQSTNIPDIELLPDIREAKDLNFENSTPLKRKIDNVVGSTSHHQQTLSPTGAALPVPRTPVFSTNGKAPFRAGLHDSVHLDDEWGYERPEKRQRVSEASRYNECRTYAPPHPPENEHALYDPMHRRTQTETEYTYAMPEYLYPHASAQLHSTHTLPATESLQVLATAAEISPRRHFPAPLSPSTPERAGPSWYNGLNQAPAPRHDSDGSQQDYFGGARYLSSGDATRNRFQSDSQNSQSGHWISSSTLMASPQNYNVEGSGQPMSRSGSDATPRRFDPADILPPIQGLAPQQRALPYAPPNHSSGTVIQGLYQTSLHPTYGYSAKPAARSLDAESPGLAQPSRAYEYNTETQGSQPARID